MCPSLPDPMNGEIVYSSGTTGDQEFGATATYICESDFGLSGGERVRTCTSDGSSTTGSWTGSAPSCLGKQSAILFEDNTPHAPVLCVPE